MFFLICHFLFASPYVRVDEYDDTGMDTVSVFEEETNRECVAYAAGEGLWKKGIDMNNDDWTVSAKDFKYTWKPIDCNTKAPFLCQYNPGLSNIIDKIIAKILIFTNEL